MGGGCSKPSSYAVMPNVFESQNTVKHDSSSIKVQSLSNELLASHETLSVAISSMDGGHLIRAAAQQPKLQNDQKSALLLGTDPIVTISKNVSKETISSNRLGGIDADSLSRQATSKVILFKSISRTSSAANRCLMTTGIPPSDSRLHVQDLEGLDSLSQLPSVLIAPIADKVAMYMNDKVQNIQSMGNNINSLRTLDITPAGENLQVLSRVSIAEQITQNLYPINNLELDDVNMGNLKSHIPQIPLNSLDCSIPTQESIHGLVIDAQEKINLGSTNISLRFDEIAPEKMVNLMTKALPNSVLENIKGKNLEVNETFQEISRNLPLEFSEINSAKLTEVMTSTLQNGVLENIPSEVDKLGETIEEFKSKIADGLNIQPISDQLNSAKAIALETISSAGGAVAATIANANSVAGDALTAAKFVTQEAQNISGLFSVGLNVSPKAQEENPETERCPISPENLHTLSDWIEYNHPETFKNFQDSSISMVLALTGSPPESEMGTFFAKLAAAKDSMANFQTSFNNAISTATGYGGVVADGARAIAGAANSLKEIADKIVESVDAISNVHPIVKISWMLLSAGYKLSQDIQATDDGFKSLAADYSNVLPKLQLYLDMNVTAIAKDNTKCSLLGNSVEELLSCTNELVVIYLKHSKDLTKQKGLKASLGKAWNVGTDKKTLETVKERILKAQVELQNNTTMVTGAVVMEVSAEVNKISSKQEEYHEEITKRFHSMKALFSGRSGARTDEELLMDLALYLKPSKYSPESKQFSGRKWITMKVVNWYKGKSNDDDEDSEDEDSDDDDCAKERQVFRLSGKAGCGKSIMSQMVIKKFDEKDDLLTPLFYFYHHMERNSAQQCVMTLAYQLAERDVEIRKAMLIVCQRNSEWFESTDAIPSLSDLFHTLITKPLKNKPAFICIDSLDECGASTRAEFTALIGSSQMPSTIKFFLTSRPGIPDIRKNLARATHLQFNEDDPKNQSDLKKFAQLKFDGYDCLAYHSKLSNWTQEIVEKCKGNFLTLTLAFDAIDTPQHPNSSKEFEKRYTNVVKNDLSNESLLEQVLARIIENPNDPVVKHVLDLIAILVALKLPMPAHCLAVLADLDNVVVEAQLSWIHALLKSRSNIETDVVEFKHKTVFEYLTCEANAVFKYINVAAAHLKLAERCIELLSHCKVNCCAKELYSIFVGYHSPPTDISTTLDYTTQYLLEYCFSHWMTHLQSKFEISEDLYDPFANFVNLYGAAALIAAFKKRMAWFVELILKAGNGQLILEAADFAGCYEVALIHEAASLGLSDMVHLFLSYGKAKPQTKGLYGRTVLHAAVRSGSVRTVKVIMSFLDSVDPFFEWTDVDGWTPYTYCEMFGFQEILYYLTSMQRHQNFDPLKTKLKMDLLFIRAWNNQLNESTDYLYTCVNKQNALDSNRTILHYCSERGHSDSVQKLLEKNANIDAMDDNGLTSLHIAAENGHVNVVDALLKAGCLVDVPTSKQWTPLHFAAWHGYADIATLLLDQTAFVDSVNEDRCTPLHIAARKGHIGVVEALLEQGALPDAVDRMGQTPLHYTAWHGHRKVAQVLLKNGANIHAKRNDNCTPLHYAARNGRAEMVECLVDNGAIMDAQNNDNRTPLHLAAYKGNAEIVELLLKRGASMDALDERNQTVLHLAASNGCTDVAKLLLSKGVQVDSRTSCQETPLHFAAQNLRVDVAELLLTKGADVSAKTEDLWTPLHFAAVNGSVDVADLLILKGANVDESTKDNWRPLHFACETGHIEVVALLIEKGAYLDSLTKDKETPLHFAAENGSPEVFELLLQRGAGVDCRTSGEETALHYAARYGSTEVSALLLRKKAQVDALTVDSLTPLHYSARFGSTSVAKLLLKEGAVVDAVSVQGFTPLHFAVINGSLTDAQLLLENGANINSKTKMGWVPLLFAVNGSHSDLIDFFVSKWTCTAAAFEKTKWEGYRLCSQCAVMDTGLKPYKCLTCSEPGWTFNIFGDACYDDHAADCLDHELIEVVHPAIKLMNIIEERRANVVAVAEVPQSDYLSP